MSIILFEDEQVVKLSPVTIGRAAFSISCGSFRLIDEVAEMGHAVAWIVRPHLRDILEADQPKLGKLDGSAKDPVLMVNACLVPSITQLSRLGEILKAGTPGIIHRNGRVAVALLPPDVAPPPLDADFSSLAIFFQNLKLDALDGELALIDYPHEIVRYHVETLGANLEARLARHDYREVADGVFLASGAQLGEHVVTDTSGGPIVLEQDATVGPYCYINGPAHLGPRARVIEHAAIKDAVSLGHTTKIGGEVEASIIEPYTNKQHHGFMGHSYLGSWINLGAGTCNSDLKNTYGTVNMEYGGVKVNTGMQFIGCIIGDYSKTAINTGIFTGKTIGACSMIYGFVTTNVPSFVNYARLFGQVTETPVEVLIATQARMFARRDVPQRPCDVQLLHDMYSLTQHDRQLAGEPLVL